MKLISLRFYLTLATFLFSGLVSANDSYICQHNTGTIQFISEEIIVEKEGNKISIYQLNDGKKVISDSWDYEVVSESKSYGLQAIRRFFPPKDTPFDVTTGGLFFIIWGDSAGFLNNTRKPFVYVVSADADSKTTSSEVLSCKKSNLANAGVTR
jgi:hypothetical protein